MEIDLAPVVTKKRAVKSKTLGAAVALPLLTVIPGVKEVIASNPQESMAAVSAIFALLRIFTKGKISL